MNLPPDGPNSPGFETQSNEALASTPRPENVIDIREYLERKAARDATTDARPSKRDAHPTGLRRRKTARRTLEGLGIYRPNGDDPA